MSKDSPTCGGTGKVEQTYTLALHQANGSVVWAWPGLTIDEIAENMKMRDAPRSSKETMTNGGYWKIELEP